MLPNYNFFHIPKCAGNSFIELAGDKIINHGHKRALEPYPGKFTIVRNPYDRLVSAYHYLVTGGLKSELDLGYQQIVSKYTSFKDFVMHLKSDKLTERIIHLRPMCYWVFDRKLLVSQVFKIEEPEKINAFLASLGVEGSITNSHANISKHLPYTEYLDPTIIKEINKIYDPDFRIFGYKRLK